MIHADGAQWRDDPILPPGYSPEDLPALVAAARKARGRIVEFGWRLSEDAMQGLRRAVFEWGSRSAGSYKVFDARVLDALNIALGDENFVLTEPKGAPGLDCLVGCSRGGDTLMLAGHCPFDVLFGYGQAAVAHAARLHLAPEVQEALVAAIVDLGWDVRLLQEERFRAVRNVMFGLSPSYGLASTTPTDAEPIDLPVHFRGPLKIAGDGVNLFSNEIATRSGIYIWTIEVAGEQWPWYVGQTRRSFGQRTAEHVRSILAGEYWTLDPVMLRTGRHKRADMGPPGLWPDTLPAILARYETLVPMMLEQIRAINVHCAVVAGNQHLLNRIEGALGRLFQMHENAALRDFFWPGIRVPAELPHDSPLRLVLSSETPITGLPPELSVPSNSANPAT